MSISVPYHIRPHLLTYLLYLSTPHSPIHPPIRIGIRIPNLEPGLGTWPRDSPLPRGEGECSSSADKPPRTRHRALHTPCPCHIHCDPRPIHHHSSENGVSSPRKVHEETTGELYLNTRVGCWVKRLDWARFGWANGGRGDRGFEGWVSSGGLSCTRRGPGVRVLGAY